MFLDAANIVPLEPAANEHEDNGQTSGRNDWKTKFLRFLRREKTDKFNAMTSSTSDQHSVMNNETHKTSKHPPAAISVNESRRKKEDNMAVIFMGFIVVFLVCHLPRLLLNIHELITIEDAMRCMRAGLIPFPLWSEVMIR